MKQPPPRRAAAVACLVGCVLGALLTVAGVAWSIFGGQHLAYSPEQAKEWDEASAAWHAATSSHADHHSAGSTPGADDDRDAAVAAARQRFERADGDLRHARFVKNRLGQVLAWIGLAIAGAFGVGYLASRGE